MTFLGYLFRQIFIHPKQLPPDLDLSGQTILITGANSGIGREAAIKCAHLKASRLILAVRSVSKGEEVKTQILRDQSLPFSRICNIDIWELDLNTPSSVIVFGAKVQTLNRLDVAILNAGVFSPTFTTTPSTGHESMLQVNHLSTALISLLLLPVLEKSGKISTRPARLTFTSSEVHMWTSFKEGLSKSSIFDEIDKPERFETWGSYANSKLLNVFWALGLSERINSSEVVINLLNPGSVDTGLHRDFNKALQTFDRIVGRTPDEGARLLLDAALVQSSTTHGKFLSENKITPFGAVIRGDKEGTLQMKVWQETMEELQRYAKDTGVDLPSFL
ncbi:putative 3-oxoacyl-reductase [Talaromyces proteolyticus]|uniref:3-oxoacyl-reductase n=1 Tax=Talaromyces proteolyticus TaxID=1131652 RepID=A0AAD4Q130_9EURO|nr:putative 3-oxoacyl-reductase [Talaromyces proteolyticus]KAH8697818.1 putative 3-oxoacyl-reductase [Talaromyces proteolyticus]